MKRIGWILIFVFAICSYEKVWAVGCTNEEINDFQKYANNITYVLEPVIDENDNPKFNLTFSGVYTGFRISLDFNGIDFKDYYPISGEKISELTLNNLSAGEKYVFKVHGTSKCYTHTFRTFTINLPDYNPYYNSEVCSDAKEYSLCQKWTKINLDYDAFTNNVLNYKNNRKAIDEEIVPTTERNWLNDLYNNYYWYFLIGLIIVFGVLAYLWAKEQKRNQL